MAGQWIHVIRYKDGLVKTSRINVKRTEVLLNPDFEALGAFKINLPDGTIVRDERFPGVAYEVKGHEIQAYVDPTRVAVLDKTAKDIRSGLPESQPAAPSATQHSESGTAGRAARTGPAMAPTVGNRTWIWGLVLLVTAVGLILIRRQKHTHVK